MKLITILSGANGNFQAEQHAQTMGVVVLINVLMAVVLFFLLARSRAWKWMALPLVLLLFAWFLSRVGQGTVYRVDIDRSGGQVVSQELDGQKIVSETKTPLGDIASAELQFNRGARKIVIVRRDGQQVFPLGEQDVQNEPDQYVVLNALRQAIGQTPVAPPKE